MKEILTACTADCPGTCSIIAKVENGKIVKLRGNPEHELTSGFICKNTRHYLEERFYSPQRILHPLKKEDGEWVQIEWEEALEIVADKLRYVSEKHGSQSILYYQGYGARTALRILNRRFFNLLGGVSTLYGSICGGTGQAGQEMDMGIRLSHDPVSHLNSNVIIIWGRNPAVTDIHLWKILIRAQKKGAKLMVIDPVKTESTRRADLHVQPSPGSDIYLAMALAKIIIEENLTDYEFIENYTKNFEDYLNLLDTCSLEELSRITDITLDELFNLAILYTEGSPSSIILGWGLQRYKKGHLTFRLINALAAITGNIGKLGGGVSHGFDEYGYFNHDYALDESSTNGRKLAMPILGDEILQKHSPPIKLIFITAGNPLAMLANSSKVKKAFESVDYVIMVDQFLNDTADLSDLFLPATSFLEDEDLVGSYGHHWISPITPVIEPQGECKSELQIFQELAEKLGFGDEMVGTPQEWLGKLAEPIIDEGISLEELLSKSHRFPSAPITPFADGKFLTKSGKFEFITGMKSKEIFTEDIIDNGLKLNNDTLRLLSISPKNWIGSEIPEKEREKGILEVQVHPKILKRENIHDGDNAWLESGEGRLLVMVKENHAIRPDFVLTYRGGWQKYGKCVNVLTRDLISDEGNGAPYYESFVKLRRIV